MAIPRATPKGRIGPSTLSQFSMKGGPKSIHKFDDSDISESVSSSGASSLPVEVVQDNNQCSTILPRSVPSHLLMISILEQLCMMYAKDSGKGKELFNLISEHLIRLKICSPLTMLDAMGSIRSQYRLFMHNVLKVAMLKLSNSSLQPLPAHLDLNIPRVESRVPLTNEHIVQSHTSRYQTEFTELGKIGKGGFGSVFKARHNLDGRIYAIKKIKFKHSRPEIWMRVLREVKALANLQHVNIVGYNAAWQENVHCIQGSPFSSGKVTEDSIYRPPEESFNPQTQTSETDDSVIFAISNSQQDNVISVQESIRITELKSTEYFESSSSSEICIACEESRNNSAEGKAKTGFVKNHSCTCTLKFFQKEFPSTSPNGKLWDEINMSTFWDKRIEIKRSLSCDPLVSTEKTNNKAVIKHNLSDNFLEDLSCSKIQVNLYIQMELCSFTLKEWLERRNQCCADLKDFMSYEHVNTKIFKQILKGVDYIHSNGLIHRDLKPRNIFLHEPELHVKIGDFGLAKGAFGSDYKDDVLLTPTPDTEEEINWDDHTSGVGTSTYAAPEQLKSSVYSIKSDIYSLGVILYEEFHMFKTDMEKFHCLDCLRNGEIDETTCKYWPNQVKAIEKMTSIFPSERPSAKELLQSELFLTKDQIIADLKGLLSHRDKEIEQLKAVLKERDKVIDALKQDIDSQIHNFKK